MHSIIFRIIGENLGTGYEHLLEVGAHHSAVFILQGSSLGFDKLLISSININFQYPIARV